MIFYLKKGRFFLRNKKKHAFLSKKLSFLAEKKCVYFFRLAIGKNEVDILNLHLFRTSVQKIGDGYFFFYFSKGFGVAGIRPPQDHCK